MPHIGNYGVNQPKIPYFILMRNKPLVFNPSDHALTLGVELELQVLDESTLLLTPLAKKIMDEAKITSLKKEFFQSTLELTTGVCSNVQEVQVDLQNFLSKAHESAIKLGLKISSTGTHPEADYRDRTITPTRRYYELADHNQWLIRRMAVYGMHIHVGMPSADEAIQFNNFLLHFVPHVLALSASSPFWQRMDTGLAAARPTIFESMPTCGLPYVVKDWKQFQKLYNSLIQSKSIASMKDLWWDIRPSPTYGTIELRICDEPATLQEALAIVAFVHLLAHWYFDHPKEWRAKRKTSQRWMLRENKWRAIRFGLDAQIIVQHNKKPVKIADDIFHWLEQFSTHAKSLGYESYVEAVEEILKNGNSTQRQLEVFNRTNDLHEVTRLNVMEFESALFKLTFSESD
ncbi:MAG TPA: YbdK family carboxylate-amine ligase [Cyclobacteriaceae bacterium]|nr:YbdK family carboxylate-amine ligase [Cyclobacteriaceae bacterium]